jgi:DNA sulfur modification protein DndD
MYLKSVQLKNWRSYKSATFNFPAPRPNKKVMLIGAMNGHGKTSLLMALSLGLFGREAMKFIEGYVAESNDYARGYRQLLARLLHRQALNDDDDVQMMVDLVFADAEGEEVRVTRTWNFRPGGQVRDLDDGDGEEVLIEVRNHLLRHSGWQDANSAIAGNLFPLHVMACFFFDGEQAQNRVEAAGGNAIMEAIQALYGTGLVDDLEVSLRDYGAKQRTSLKREVGDEQRTDIDAKRAELDAREVQLMQIRKRKDELASALSEADRGRNAVLWELQQIGTSQNMDLEQIGRRRIELEERKRDLSYRFVEGLAGAALPIALQRTSRFVERQLNREIVRDDWEALKAQAIPKADQIVQTTLPSAGDPRVDPPLSHSQREALEDILRTALTSLWSPPPADCADVYRFTFLSSSDRRTVASQFAESAAPATGDLGTIAEELQRIKQKLREAQRSWEQQSDVKPRVDQLRASYEEADAKFQQLANERAALESQERGLDAQVGDLNAVIRKMEENLKHRGPAEERIELVERVRAVIKDTRERLVPLCRAAIAESCTRHFRAMISDEYRSFTVDIDEDRKPVLRGPAGEQVPVGSMSGAQKRAFGLAFTLAVAEASGEECPIVIDTPVGNMDTAYRMRILKYLARSSPGQLIFLSHDEEISREYARELDTYVAEKYLIEFQSVADGVGVSSVRQGRYFTR